VLIDTTCPILFYDYLLLGFVVASLGNQKRIPWHFDPWR